MYLTLLPLTSFCVNLVAGAMMQFPVIFSLMDTSIHKQKNKFIP
jgi:hypothetical protein